MTKNKFGRIGFLFSLPTLLIFVFFLSVPVVVTFTLAFAEWTGFVLKDIEFIGFRNFFDVFSDKIFLKSLLNTIIFVVLTTISLNILGFLIALVINSDFPGTKFLKNIIFLPVLLSPIIIGIMWSRMLDAFGIINQLLQSLRLTDTPIMFLGSGKFALFTVIGAVIWQFTGYDMLIYYAGLKGISKDLIEAAKIDGAGEFRIIMRIILPSLSHVITVAVLLNMIGGFKVFDVVFIMTAGGPNHNSEVLATYLFQQAFKFNDMGFASVIAIVIIIASLITSILRIKLTERNI